MKKKSVESKVAGYITITKNIEVEECYKIISRPDIDSPVLTVEDLKNGLESGDLNLIQSATNEPLVFLVAANGQRLATLEKDGGCNGETRVIKVS